MSLLAVSPLAATPADALHSAAPDAPYLTRLWDQLGEQTQSCLSGEGPAALFEQAFALMHRAGQGSDDATAARDLRMAKRMGHLAIAAADLSGLWDVEQTVAAITRLADAAVQAALATALSQAELSADGLFVIALGKMGAGELNYSSDIDIAAFYDPDVFDGGRRAPGDAASRVVRHMTRLLDERTAEGYVFRTDLRLRPDPRSTPVAVSTRMAEQYYESVGQNWERMVWIKARAMAGDLDAAARFTDVMTPFVWRRHLDYWAINDIHAIKRMINAQSDRAALEAVDPDVKLGAGGIREIEFFAQTQQLILGGRSPDLRQPTTLGTLAALTEAGVVDPSVCDTLCSAYRTLRAVEHRIQMRQDEQTHAVPRDTETRAAVARLCGMGELEAFDRGLADLRAEVHAIYTELFALEDRERDRAQAGNLVFTGVDDDPGTVSTLTDLGFADPSHIIETIRHWHRGHAPATRTSRGRELLTALLPPLLEDMSATGDATAAFDRFRRFFDHLPSGVQTLSMLLAEPKLRCDLIQTLALAPRLAERLGRRPALLEALLRPGEIAAYQRPVTDDFETHMNEMRRYQRDRAFLIGYDLLHGVQTPATSARAYSDLADLVVNEMAGTAAVETAKRYGHPPGDWLVCAMGKLGGREMTVGSDLDLIVIYASEDTSAAHWFIKFTQRLITALTAETGEGGLYEVDMRLRPSGQSGPVAVRASTFERYQREEAWTWERMALTRLRPVAGGDGLRARIMASVESVLGEPVEAGKLLHDVRDMRQRLWREKPPAGPWDVKLTAGGLIDIEFIAQYGLLATGIAQADCTHTPSAISALTAAGWLDADAGTSLRDAYDLQAGLQQLQRLALTETGHADAYPTGLKARMARFAGCRDFAALEARLVHVQSIAATLRERLIGALV